MRPVDLINSYYLKYGADEAACAREYYKNNNSKEINRKIKKLAIYYPIMNRGGVQRVVSLMLPLYEKMGYEIVLITEVISGDDYNVPESVKRVTVKSVKEIDGRKFSYRERAQDFEKIFIKEQIDVFIHHGVRLPFFVYDMLLAHCMRIYTIAEKHQIFTQGFCDIDDKFYIHKEIFRIIDKVIVLSSAEKKYWKYMGIDANCIENPYNLSLTDLKCKKNNENIVWVGRLDINSKQYFDVIEIAKVVVKNKPGVKFLMYGSGNNSLINELNSIISENKLNDNVIFCGYEPDITRIYLNARIHLVTSAYEAFPMGIYESRICGIPLVMYELPYLELLKEKKGFLSSVNGDVSNMAENICKILDDKELEERLRIEAKESIKKFSNDLVCEKWEKIFFDIENNHKEVSENEDVKMIIETMHKHYAIAQKKYEKLLWKSEQEKLIYHVTMKMGEYGKIVICPYGMVGKKVKKMLNEKEIYETYIVDNTLSKYDSTIKSMDEINKMDCSEVLFVICSEQEEIKNIFYDSIREIADKEQIIYYDQNII